MGLRRQVRLRQQPKLHTVRALRFRQGMEGLPEGHSGPDRHGLEREDRGHSRQC